MKKVTLVSLLVATLAFANTNGNQRPPQPMSADKLISQMDTDGDGKLSSDEVKGPLKNDFSKIDSDGDGYLSSQEIETNAPKPQNSGGQRPPRQ